MTHHTSTVDRPQSAAGNSFPGSAAYWERRYAQGGNSGAGSYGRLARFKAEVVNELVVQNRVRSVIDLGCGDGHQLGLLKLADYVGFDISETSLQTCRERYRGDTAKRFLPMAALPEHRADLCLSLDVVYHLVEDPVFERYMHSLFDASSDLVVIYASNPPNDHAGTSPHVRHRAVTRWVAQERHDFRFLGAIENPYPLVTDPINESFAHFMLFKRLPATGPRSTVLPGTGSTPLVSPGKSDTPGSAVAALPANFLERLPLTRQIVAGMATVAGNESALFEALGSLLPQVDRIDLYCNGHSRVPALLEGHPKIRCIVDTDGRRRGDAGKFWGLQDSDDCIYLSCDDDIAYPSDYVSRMVEVLARHRGQCVVTVHGARIRQVADGMVRHYYEPEVRSVFHFEAGLVADRPVHIPGTGTAVFHSHYVKPALDCFERPNMADLWLSKFLLERGTPVIAIARPANWLRQLAVTRPTIYGDSSRRRSSDFDTGAAQSALVTKLFPLSLLRGSSSATTAYVIRVESRFELDQLLLSVERSDPDAVIILMDGLAPLDRRLGLKECGTCACELHILPPDLSSDLRQAYRSLLAVDAATVHCLALSGDGHSSKLVELGGNAIEELFARH